MTLDHATLETTAGMAVGRAMPDSPTPRFHDHPARCRPAGSASGAAAGRVGGGDERPGRGLDGPAYAELYCLSNFSFLRGASHPEELVGRAAELGYAALALTDRNSLAGVVRAHVAAREHGLHLVIGAELTPVAAPPVVVLAPTRAAYARLARLITRGRLRCPKGACEIRLSDIAELAGGAGLIALVVPAAESPLSPEAFRAACATYRDIFGRDTYLAATLTYDEPDEARLAALTALGEACRLPLVAAGQVHYHVPERRYLQDVLTCIREKCTLATAGRRLFANAERHLRPRDELGRRYGRHAALLRRAVELARRCTFSLDELRYEYPHELVPAGRTAMEYLAELTWAGCRERYPQGVPAAVRSQLEAELALIADLHYEHYFLTVWDLVRFARERGILCQGRGSAANSAVCYCLGVTAVDPARIELLFERFISRERNEPPDIDIDFEHERREEVYQYIYAKYGRERAALTAEVITYRPRSAVRDVGKALGLSLDRVDVLAKSLDWWSSKPLPDDALRAAGLDPRDRTVQMLVRLVRQLLGFPRHLSQHVGGFVITETPLCEIVPLLNGGLPDRTFIEWDKDDIDALGILKVDCLALGMLTALGKALGMLGKYDAEGLRDFGIEGLRRSAAPHEQWKLGAQGPSCGVVPHDESRPRESNRENGDGSQADVPGSDRLAEGNPALHGDLRRHAADARGGAIRADGTDAAGRGVGSQQHRRGQRAGHAEGLSPQPDHRARLAGGIGDTTAHCPGTRLPERDATPAGADGRGLRDAPGPDQPAPREASPAQPARALAPASPAASVRQPQSLNPSVPQSLSPLIPQALADIPPEDPAVYDLICAADTVGVFQIESRAQMSMLPRLRPRCFYDLVIEVAIVRPGPIQGGMVHPYLRRRDGLEPVSYPSEAVRGVLSKTLGVPLFQEQVMRLAVVAAGFTPGEADQLRRAMAAWRRSGDLEPFRARLIRGMLTNGYSPEYAEQLFQQIRGFGEYGFPESHAASFALLVYASAWLKRYHPAAFCGAVLNAQPMGFYAPAQLVRDAQRHGVTVLPVDVNASAYDCTLEPSPPVAPIPADAAAFATVASGLAASAAGTSPARPSTTTGRCRRRTERPGTYGASSGPALRLGFRLVRGLSAARVRGVCAARAAGPIESIEQLARRPDVSRDTLLRLAAADAFRSLGLSRRDALWRILACDDAAQPLWAELEPEEPVAALPLTPRDEAVVQDYDALGLSLTAHPLELIRAEVARLRLGPRGELRVSPARALTVLRPGQRVAVAGLVTHRQRPGTAKGIVFMTLEDESGTANLIIRPTVWERERGVAATRAALIAEGHVERQGAVIHVQVQRFHDLGARLGPLRTKSRDFR